MKKCKNYDTCGFEADETAFKVYKSSTNKQMYYRSRCPDCFDKYSSQQQKYRYKSSKGLYYKKQKENFDSRLINEPGFKEKISERQATYRAAHKKERKEFLQEYYKKPEARFKKSKSAAHQREIIWTLDFENFKRISSEPCYYCSNQFCSPVKTGVGLDRLDSSKGYELDNVVACGKLCNQLKMDILTPEETKVAVAAILNYRKNKQIITSPEN